MIPALEWQALAVPCAHQDISVGREDSPSVLPLANLLPIPKDTALFQETLPDLRIKHSFLSFHSTLYKHEWSDSATCLEHRSVH